MLERLREFMGNLKKTKLEFEYGNKIYCSDEEIEALKNLFGSIEKFVDYINNHILYQSLKLHYMTSGTPHNHLLGAIYQFEQSKTEIAEKDSAYSKLLKYIKNNLQEQIKNMENILREFIKMHNKLERNIKDLKTISGQKNTKLQIFLNDILKYDKRSIDDCQKSIKEGKGLLLSENN